ncbi:hypothetical protein [Streptomyces sp. SID1121]|uniref:hypothetical protein n=1 Tax=Streptomyces sp. SID1121 TaxID=3425888 RepID=UPI004057A0C0
MSAPALLPTPTSFPIDEGWLAFPSLAPHEAVPADRDWDTVTFTMGLGWRVLDTLRAGDVPMGPFLFCGEHRLIHLPVTPWPALPKQGLVRVAHATLKCPGQGSVCLGAIWHVHPAQLVVLTNAAQVFDGLHLVRTGAVRQPRPLARCLPDRYFRETAGEVPPRRDDHHPVLRHVAGGGGL